MSIRAPSHRRSVRRTAWLAAWLALAVGTPAVAGAGGTAIAVYLPSADSLTKDEASDVEAVLISGLHQAARGGTISVREPTLLRPSCGRNPSDACLAGLAGDGAVLISRARRDGIHVVVSMALVNGKGRRTRWTSFVTTLVVQDARPCAQALFFLEDELSRPGSGTPLVAAPSRAVAPEPKPEPKPQAPAQASAAPVQPVPVQPPAPEARPEPAQVAAATEPPPVPPPVLRAEPPKPPPRPVVVRAPPPPRRRRRPGAGRRGASPGPGPPAAGSW